MVYFYSSTLAGLFAAEAAVAGMAQTGMVGAIHELPLQDLETPTAPSGFVAFDPYEDVRKEFEVDLTVDPSRFGASPSWSQQDEIWLAAAQGPKGPLSLFEGAPDRAFRRAQKLFGLGQDGEAFVILHNLVTRAENPQQARIALIRAHVALEEVFETIPLNSTAAFETEVENPILQRRYFCFVRELWRFRSRFLSEALRPDMTTTDQMQRLTSWAQELQRRAHDFHVDLAADGSSRLEQLAENRRHYHRADEILVQESLFIRDFKAAEAIFNSLLASHDKETRPSDHEGQLKEYRLYRLGHALYQSRDNREEADRFRFRSLIFAVSLLQSAPDRAVQDLLSAAEELSISDEHESRELNFIADSLAHQMAQIERGPASPQRNPEHILRGFFSVIARMIEALIKQTPVGERRTQIGELQVLRQDIDRLVQDLPSWQEGGDLEVYLKQGKALLWELKLILVRSQKAAGRFEQAVIAILAAIAGLSSEDHARLYRAYRLLEEIFDSSQDAEWQAKAIGARLQAEAYAQVLRARGEEVEG